MAVVYWSADGLGKDVGTVHMTLIRWMRANGSPSLIVNGGDVYNKGKSSEFERLLQQVGGTVAEMCETPGNHDWGTTSSSTATGEIPSGYEAFWKRFAPPNSKQPIDASKKGGARYEHFIDLAGWRLVFLDTGPSESSAWPMGDHARETWLRETVRGVPGRAKIVFAHHSRLSFGNHGDIENVDRAWRALFDDDGTPRASLTMAGHDHNVSIYKPRPRDVADGAVAFARGIHIMVNGAGGRGHDRPSDGTEADFHFNEFNYCATKITLIDERSADIELWDFGPGKNPPPTTQPTLQKTLQIRIPPSP